MWLCNPDETKNFELADFSLEKKNVSPKFSWGHPAFHRLPQCGFGSYIIDTPVLPIILEKLFFKKDKIIKSKVSTVGDTKHVLWTQSSSHSLVTIVAVLVSGHFVLVYLVLHSTGDLMALENSLFPQHSTAAWPQLYTDVSKPSWNTLVFIVDAT